MSKRSRRKQKRNKLKLKLKSKPSKGKAVVPLKTNGAGSPVTPKFTNVVKTLGTAQPSAFGSYAGAVGVACHVNHPVLDIGGGTVLGASCLNPEEGYDIYVGLDFSMTFQHSLYPWSEDDQPKTVEFLFKITDFTAPDDVLNFKCMISWMAAELKKGKSIHVGCVGGHGRTGLVLAALVKYVDGTKDAITWIRKNYCDSAVESSEQIEFLNKHYGIKKVQGSKTAWTGTTSGFTGEGYYGVGSQSSYTPITCNSNIFGI
ncbi:MAG: hypothetical protein QQN63_04310 [Nitrosopumilus sp.]